MDCSLAATGLVCSLGSTIGEAWPRLLAGDQSRLSQRDDFAGRSLVLGAVSEALPEIPEALATFASRNNALCLAALQQIEVAARGAVEGFGAQRVAVVMGTSTSGVSDAEDAIRHLQETDRLAPRFHYAQLEFGGIAEFTADWLGARGPAYTLSTACSSGARALASARSLLALDLCDAVVAGAADSLCGLTTGGFSALQALSDTVTNPFSRNRSGLTLGEGAAAFLVTRKPGGVRLLGVGESSEAHHMSAPDPEGRGAETAMRRALEDAGLAPGAIGYLNLHGTGTPLNDAMEGVAVDRVFGGALPCSSTKPLVGHALGAAGAIEAAICWAMLDRSQHGELALAPHCFDGQPDPDIPGLHLTAVGERTDPVTRPRVMTNSFGFGGNNCTLVLGRDFPA
jgi:3-oxoacyl-[acyl-carrier-protein] synthase-1